jgi:hypothetical protein
MAKAIEEIRSRRDAVGRADLPFAMGGMTRMYVGEPGWEVGPCATGKPDALAESLAGLAAIGVTHIQVKFPARSAAEAVDQIAAFNSEVVPLLA